MAPGIRVERAGSTVRLVLWGRVDLELSPQQARALAASLQLNARAVDVQVDAWERAGAKRRGMAAR